MNTNTTHSVLVGERITFADKPLAACFFDSALAHKDALALISEQQTLTYGQLAIRVRQLMHQLLAHGVQPGQRLALQVTEDQAKVELILACMSLGITFVPVSQKLPAERARQVILRAQCDAWLYDNECPLAQALLATEFVEQALAQTPLDRLTLIETSTLYHAINTSTADTAPLIPALDAIKPADIETMVFPDLDAIAYCLFTSGSTGNPKCIEITQRGILNTILATNHAHHYRHTDRSLLLTDIGFDAVFIEIFCPLLVGGSIVTFPANAHKTPEDVWQITQTYSSTILHGSPLFLSLVAECALANNTQSNHWHHLRLIMTGGDVLTPSVYQQLRRLGHLPIANHYGPTEVSIDASYHIVTSADDICIGQPIVNAICCVVDEQLAVVAPGVIGELLVASPGLAQGYSNDPSSTAKAFIAAERISNWPTAIQRPARIYRTGDLACIVDGNISLFGRNDRQIKIRGVRGDLNEIENVLRRVPYIRDCRVLLDNDQHRGSTLTAYLCLTHTHQSRPADAQAIKQALSEQLPQQMQPSTLNVVNEFPLNKNGKIDEAKLISMPATRLQTPLPIHPATSAANVHCNSANANNPYANALEARIARVCEQQLGIQNPPRDAAFQALGAHSLLLTRIANALSTQLSVPLRTHDLLVQHSIAQLAVYCAQQSPIDNPQAILGSANATSDAPFPLSSNQTMLWLAQQMEPESTLYNVPLVIEFTGELHIDSLHMALHTLYQRHPMLSVVLTEKPIDTSARDAFNIYQQFTQTAANTLPITDLSNAPQTQVNTHIERLIEQPFALLQQPLLRTELIRHADNAFTLVIVAHHLICDGWSIEILHRELLTAYQANYSEVGSKENGEINSEANKVSRKTSDPNAVTYQTFVQQQSLASQVSEQKLAFWQQHLRDLPTLPLPTDYPRPPIKSSAGKVLSFRFSEQESAQLRHIAQTFNASLFQVLFSLFSITLRQYTQTHDIVIGIASSGREQHAYENLIGMFVNTLVVKTCCYPQYSFVDALSANQDALLQAMAHEIDFNQLLQHINPPRDASRTPLFQVMFDYHYEDIHDQRQITPTLLAHSAPRQTHSAKFDLAMDIYESTHMTVMLEYATTLFSETSMQTLLRHFRHISTVCLAAPTQPVCALPLFHEYLSLNADVTPQQTSTEAETPCVVSQFYRVAAAYPQHIALEDGTSQLTYQQLDQRSEQLAHRLIQLGDQLSVAEKNKYNHQDTHHTESIVAIYLPRSIHYVVAVIATLKAGAAFMPLDPAQPIERLATIANSSGAQVLITDEARANDHTNQAIRQPFAAEHVLCLEAILGTTHAADDIPPSPQFAPKRRNTTHAEQLAFVFYTSGSTGTPKGVMVPLRGLYNQLTLKVDAFNLQPGDGIGFIATPGFDVSIWQSLTALMVGARTVIYPDQVAWEAEALIKHTNQHQVVAIETVPSHFNSILQYLESDATHTQGFNSLNYLMLNGEALLAEHCDRWFALYPHIPIVNGYGATEVSDDCTHNLTYRHSHINRNKPMPVNGTLPGYQVYVLDALLNPVPPGAAGEICVGGLGVARGYLNQHTKTAAQFVPNPYSQQQGAVLYRTGDMACYDIQGNIYYLGRTDDQLKINGIRVELGEIETAVRALPNVEHSLTCLNTLALPHKELITFYIEAAQTAQTTDSRKATQRMQQQLADKLPLSVIPRHLIRLSAFPMKPNGKIDTKALFNTTVDTIEVQQALHTQHHVSASTEEEQQILAIWNAVLGVEHDNIVIDFFDAGGHSMSASVMLGRIQQQFGCKLSAKDFYLHPNVQHLSAAVCAMREAQSHTIADDAGFNEIEI